MIIIENIIREAAESIGYIDEIDKGVVSDINATPNRQFPLLYMIPFEDNLTLTNPFIVSSRITAPFYILINHGANTGLDVDDTERVQFVHTAYGYARDIIDYISDTPEYYIRSMNIKEVHTARFTNYICSGVLCTFVISPKDSQNC